MIQTGRQKKKKPRTAPLKK